MVAPSFEHTGYSLIPPGCTVFMPAFFARVRAQRVCGNASEIGKFRTQTAAPIIQSTRQPARHILICNRPPLQAGNGRTADFGSANAGSIPAPVANLEAA